jgi:hypothetical protein
MFNVSFNNILVILWWSVLLAEETGGPGENHIFFLSFFLTKELLITTETM